MQAGTLTGRRYGKAKLLDCASPLLLFFSQSRKQDAVLSELKIQSGIGETVSKPNPSPETVGTTSTSSHFSPHKVNLVRV
jgi:hypothetical protein